MKNSKITLYLKLSLIKNTLDERWIKGGINDDYALEHYENHVLDLDQEGSIFRGGSYFFPAFSKNEEDSKKEYLKKAEELANSPADSTSSYSLNVPGYNNAIGFEIAQEGRYIKIKSAKHRGVHVHEYVVYQRDKSNGEPIIISYYLASPNSLNSIIKRKTKDLPESELFQPETKTDTTEDEIKYLAYYKEYDEERNVKEVVKDVTNFGKHFFDSNKYVYKLELYVNDKLSKTITRQKSFVYDPKQTLGYHLQKITDISGDSLPTDFIEKFIEIKGFDYFISLDKEQFKSKIKELIDWYKEGLKLYEIIPLLERRASKMEALNYLSRSKIKN